MAIWNGISKEGREDFYQWHLHEHMPERASIPGFMRGRRYRAADQDTHPEFFTLYEVEEFEVVKGKDYSDRLNAPTPWTRRATAHFLNTSRGLAKVLSSDGPGPGGVLATIRFRTSAPNDEQAEAELTALLPELLKLPLMTGAHLCKSDQEATGIRTAEHQGRTDYDAPPNWFMLFEACTLEALRVPVQTVLENPLVKDPHVGRYVHEYTRLKTAASAG
ncbi:hypothetical protein [Ensifer aridi]|uniref:hypothetical protein n=1 Tax=Ensifer aridi TaxID=1708715 RepID=UPI001111765A|nr:hypothetical protein [Ensifer aridi]